MKRILFGLLALAFLSQPASAAFCYVSEFIQAGDAGVQVAKQPGLDQTAVAVSASSAQSAAFQPATKLIRINCDVVVSFLVGPNPTATANNARLPTGVVEYFQVNGSQQKIAFITNN